MTLWRCTVCGYIAQGDTPPMICPKCGAGADAFEPMEEKESKQESDDFFAGEKKVEDWLQDDYNDRTGI